METQAFLIYLVMKLFRYEGYHVVISEEAYALKPFRDLWRRIPGKNKDRAIQELGYVYFMCDPRSDYQYLVDEEERSKAIIEAEGLPSNFKPFDDPLIQAAMDYYKSIKTTSVLLLEDTRIAIEKLRTLLRDIDLTSTDDKGKPIYALNTITSTIKQIPSLVKDLSEAEKAINKEVEEAGKMRGQAEKSIMEDSLDI